MSTSNINQGNFAHIVFFWLKNANSEDDRNTFEASLKRFVNTSVFIKTKHVGTPANTDRPVIDSSYTYCLSLTFANKSDQDQYQEEAGHHRFIEECAELWEKVIVYDSENIL